MTLKWLLLIGFFWVGSAFGKIELQYLKSQTIPFQSKFKNTTVGGLSGAVFNGEDGRIYVVSDDRGKFGEPRIYRFEILAKNKQPFLALQDVLFVKDQFKESKTGKLPKVLDLEAIGFLPWGNFLISTEGDNNKKPRIPPELLDLKKDGTFVRSFALPKDWIPERVGKQTQGIRSNNGIEGLSQFPGGQIIAALESPLMQDQSVDAVTRFLSWEMPEAWIIKPKRQWKYPLGDQVTPGVVVEIGVSEILHFDQSRLIVLERSLNLVGASLQYFCSLYLVDLEKTSQSQGGADLPRLEKEKIIDFQQLFRDKNLGSVENFETLTWDRNPTDPDRKLLVISDDNFLKSHRTMILMFSVLEKK